MTPNAESGRVVLLHGQPGRAGEWARVIEALGPIDVVAPDRPGYGHNPLPAGGVGENVEWLRERLEADGGGAPLIVAHSWAGGMALALALRRPDLIRALVLVGSVGPGAITRFDRLLARPLAGGVRAAPRSPATRRARRAGVVRAFLTEQGALIRDLPPLIDQLGRITTPTLVIAGTRDHIVRFATARALASRLPNAELVSVPGGGHRLHRTHPELVAAVVRRALWELSPG